MRNIKARGTCNMLRVVIKLERPQRDKRGKRVRGDGTGGRREGGALQPGTSRGHWANISTRFASIKSRQACTHEAERPASAEVCCHRDPEERSLPTCPSGAFLSLSAASIKQESGWRPERDHRLLRCQVGLKRCR